MYMFTCSNLCICSRLRFHACLSIYISPFFLFVTLNDVAVTYISFANCLNTLPYLMMQALASLISTAGDIGEINRTSARDKEYNVRIAN